MLTEKYGWYYYEFDKREPDHIERLLAEGDKYYSAFMAMSEDERWILRSPEEMAEETIGGWSKRVRLVVEDLLALAHDGIILAEGPGLFPEVVFPCLSSPHQAVWLVPTAEFKWRSMKGRGKFKRRQAMSDPERAVNNHFGRDMLMAAHAEREAKKLGLKVITVDGTVNAAGVAAVVEGHFKRYLITRE
jgi:hypothetical protein